MITSVADWMSFLRDSTSASGFPLIVAGIGISLFGWRMWKVCVILAFGLIGAGVGASFSEPGPTQLIYTLACGALLAAVSSWPINYSVAILGGVIGGAAGYYYLRMFNLDPIISYAITGAIAVACTGMACINKRKVVILVTAFLGAVLVVSGLTAWVMASPGLYGTFRSMASSSVIVVPFILMVPMVMSCFYQMAEVRRLQIEL